MPKEKKVKAKKDPNAPKKALSAFMIFSSENRGRVKDENPTATFGGLGKLLGAEWGSMSDADKKVYQDKAEKDKVRYANAMAKYTSASDGHEAHSPAKSPVKSPKKE